MLRTFELEEREVNKEDPWTVILNAVRWAVQSTYHTSTLELRLVRQFLDVTWFSI